MTRIETTKVLAILKAAYPHSYKGLTKQDAEAMIALWASMFADEPCQFVEAAVQVIIASNDSDFPPSIATVKAMIHELTAPQDETAAGAWAIASKAAAGNIKWEQLPEDIQAAIGSKKILEDWGMVSLDSFNTVIYSQFLKAYEKRMTSKKQSYLMPSKTKAVFGVVDLPKLGASNDSF